MRIHFILHETFEGPGCISDWIKQKHYEVTISRTYLPEAFPGPDQFDCLIIMGGTMSTCEEKKYSWLQSEKDFIRKSVESGKIILGICFGAQLIAEALGGKVHKAKEKEIGWFPVKLRKDHLPEELRNLPENQTVFHWHGDTFDLPDGAMLLASSEATMNQAFIFGEKVMAFQYHYEITGEAIGLMLDNLGWQLKKEKYVQKPDEIIKGMNHISENNLSMFKIMDYLDSFK